MLDKNNTSRAMWWLKSCLLISAMAVSSIQAQMTTPGQFQVSESGAATFTIPIQVPPGIAGMEPRLSVSYSSQSGNGLLGMGWSLGGLGGISRCSKTVAQDGVLGSVNYDSNDRYCLDGQRLIAIAGAYGADGTEYRTERESFSKVVSFSSAGNGPAWFKVWTKAGQVMEYGNTTDSKIEAVKAVGSNAKWPTGTIRVWTLNRISDSKGNYISFTYIKDLINGDYFPSKIDYTGNTASGLTPINSVKFLYENRSDNTVFYVSSSQMRTVNRLNKIQLFAGTILTKEYQFGYNQSLSTFRSLLSSIKECTAVGNCLAPLAFNYQRGADGSFTSQTPFNFGTDIYSWQPAFWTYGDFNGDGKTDIIQHTNTPYTKRVWLSNGDGSFTAQALFNFGRDIASFEPSYWTYGDFDGDGKTDIIQQTNTPYTKRIWLSNGDGSFTAQAPFNFGTDIVSFEPSYWTYGDFDGDGKTDIIQQTNTPYTKRIWLSNGNGSFTAQAPFNFGTDINTFEPPYWTYGDFNGDGKTDIIQHTNTPYTKRVWLSNGDGSFTAQTPFNFGTDVYSWDSEFWTYGDFNGDGKTDIISHSNTPYTKRVWLSNGDGSFTAQTPFNFVADVYSWEPALWAYGDFNGDGKTDIISHSNTPYAKRVWFSSQSKQQADLLASIKNGPITLIAPVFFPISDSSVYTKEKTGMYPIIDIQSPMYVVSSVVSTNGVGGTTSTQYTYGGLKSDQSGRGLLGFRWQQAKQVETGLIAYTEFKQEWPYTGLPSLSKKTLAGGGDNGVLSQTTNSYSCNDPGNSASAPCNVGVGKRYFVFANQSVGSNFDLNGAVMPVTTTKTEYDNFGNATKVDVSTSDGFSKSTINSFSNDSTNWFLGRLLKSTVTSVAP